MKALDRAYAELDKHRRGMAEDVLDQYVHRDAVQAAAGHELPRRGPRARARRARPPRRRQKLEQCQQQHDARVGALEGSLAALRGDKFGDEQKKLDEVMNELADVAKDQDDIAAEANRIFESYAEQGRRGREGSPARGEQEGRRARRQAAQAARRRSTRAG